jgi:diguanylate cyclase (GGDEF)-like protein
MLASNGWRFSRWGRAARAGLWRTGIRIGRHLAFAAAIALKNAHLVEQLQSAATTDPLTSLGNRRAMEERLDAELSRGRRHSLHTSVVLVDVDRFKLVNDTLGHAAGDRWLVLIGQILRQQCRTLDAVGRMGGDEYLVILPMTTAEEAMALISRVQGSVAALERSHPEFGRPSLSMGIAEAPRHGASPSTLLAGADSALYRAKRWPQRGRSRRGYVDGGSRVHPPGRRALAGLREHRSVLPHRHDHLPDHAAYVRWNRAPVERRERCRHRPVRRLRDQLLEMAQCLDAGRTPSSALTCMINGVLGGLEGTEQLIRVVSLAPSFSDDATPTPIEAIAASAAARWPTNWPTCAGARALIAVCTSPTSPQQSRRWCSPGVAVTAGE